MGKWDELRIYVKKELDKPMNNDDIQKSILEDILHKMDFLDSKSNIDGSKSLFKRENLQIEASVKDKNGVFVVDKEEWNSIFKKPSEKSKENGKKLVEIMNKIVED